MENNNEIKTVTFDDNEYDIQDLTPRAIEMFNVVFKAQQNLNNLAMDVKLTQASISALNSDLKTILKDDLFIYSKILFIKIL